MIIVNAIAAMAIIAFIGIWLFIIIYIIAQSVDLMPEEKRAQENRRNRS